MRSDCTTFTDITTEPNLRFLDNRTKFEDFCNILEEHHEDYSCNDTLSLTENLNEIDINVLELESQR